MRTSSFAAKKRRPKRGDNDLAVLPSPMRRWLRLTGTDIAPQHRIVGIRPSSDMTWRSVFHGAVVEAAAWPGG
jgi:hypothetical protein